MKTSTKIFSLSFLIIMIAPIFIAQPVAGAVKDLGLANLTIKPISVEDRDGVERTLDSNGRYAKFKIDWTNNPSQVDFKSTSVQTDQGQVIFYATLVYRIPVNYWTYYNYQDFIHETNTREYTWLTHSQYKIHDPFIGDRWFEYLSIPPAKVSWDYMILKPGSLGHFKNPKLEIQFDALPEILLESIGESNATMSSAITKYSIKSVSCDKSSIKEIGNYKTEYGSTWTGAKVELQDTNAIHQKTGQDATSIMSSALKTEMLGKIAAESIGVSAPIFTPSTHQQSTPVGTTEVGAIGFQRIDNRTIHLTTPIDLRPKIDKITQSITVRPGFIEERLKYGWWTAKITGFNAYPSIDKNSDIRGLSVQNYVIQEYYDVEVDLVSTLKLDPSIKPAQILAIPNVLFSDVYWDMQINGNSEAWITLMQQYNIGDFLHDTKVTSDSVLGLLEDWLPWILGAIGLFAVIYLISTFQPLISSSVKASAAKKR